jgi:hypothetical protein
MLLQNATPDFERRLRDARRFFSLVPLVVFLGSLLLFGTLDGHSYVRFLHIMLQAIAVSLASVFISIAAYGFYRYLNERSPGL